jgi:uncharacterized protein (DUF983 family)
VPDTIPSRWRIVLWGLARRCPRCGAGHLFPGPRFWGWFTLAPDCPRCHLHFEREEGYWAGALAINIGITFGLFAIVFIALVAATIPEIPVVPLLAVLVPIVVITPIVAYPFSKTIWMALDHAFLLRMEPGGPPRRGRSEA